MGRPDEVACCIHFSAPWRRDRTGTIIGIGCCSICEPRDSGHCCAPPCTIKFDTLSKLWRKHLQPSSSAGCGTFVANVTSCKTGCTVCMTFSDILRWISDTLRAVIHLKL
uniref:Uncharacterized protein n=1 Tax=Rhipicephalus zambeziensis TaxID=60191 RepID=A0A224YBY1_9ACAR